ncbi:MAG: phosphatase PAP2 family protein [Candidatus Eisenbacteria bacterium]
MRLLRIKVLTALALAVFTLAAHAMGPDTGNPAASARMTPNPRYFKHCFSDAGYMLTRPLSWGASDWLKFSLVVGVTATLADEDEDIQVWVETRRNAGTARVAGVAKSFGDGTYIVPAFGALYCFGYLSGSGRARRTALLGLESLAIAGVFTEVIKHTAHKHRPVYGGVEEVAWDGPSFSRVHRSFPSGHSAAAFAAATVVASEYGNYAFVTPLMYSAATLCALSRMHDDAHWLSDIVIGSLIGHLVARTVVDLNGGPSGGGLSLTPVMRERGVGVSMSYRF